MDNTPADTDKVPGMADNVQEIKIPTFREQFGYLRYGSVYDVEDAIALHRGYL